MIVHIGKEKIMIITGKDTYTTKCRRVIDRTLCELYGVVDEIETGKDVEYELYDRHMEVD